MYSIHQYIESQYYINYIIGQTKMCYLNLIILSKSYNVNLCKLGTEPNQFIIVPLQVQALAGFRLTA